MAVFDVSEFLLTYYALSVCQSFVKTRVSELDTILVEVAESLNGNSDYLVTSCTLVDCVTVSVTCRSYIVKTFSTLEFLLVLSNVDNAISNEVVLVILSLLELGDCTLEALCAVLVCVTDGLTRSINNLSLVRVRCGSKYIVIAQSTQKR